MQAQPESHLSGRLDRRWRWIFHEAGHTAVALAFGLKVDRVQASLDLAVMEYVGLQMVRVVPDLVTTAAGTIAEVQAVRKTRSGRFSRRSPAPFSRPKRSHRFWLLGWERRPDFTDEAVVWLNAAAVETCREARRMVPIPLNPNREVLRRIIRRAEKAADAVLRRNWGWVEKLAQEIHGREDGVITGDEILRLFGRPVLPSWVARGW